MEEKKVPLVEWRPYTQHGFKREEKGKGWINRVHTHMGDRRQGCDLLNGDHTQYGSQRKGVCAAG